MSWPGLASEVDRAIVRVRESWRFDNVIYRRYLHGIVHVYDGRRIPPFRLRLHCTEESLCPSCAEFPRP
jgi:hypothetical protein